MKMASNGILFITALSVVSISVAFDPRPLQDFCVRDYTGKAPCKDPKTVTVDDFFRGGLNIPGNTSNPYGASITGVNVANTPGSNGLGISIGRADFAPHGYFPPHIHPRSSEIVAVVSGVMEVGFITSYPDYKYYSKILEEGDVIIIPPGLVHVVRNVGRGPSVITAVFNSQNPGFAFIPDNVFAANPAVNASYLAKAFKLEEMTVKDLQAAKYFTF